MRTISRIPERDLHMVLDDLYNEGAPIVSIDKDGEGLWSVAFTAPPAISADPAAGTAVLPPAEDGSVRGDQPAIAARKIGPQMILYLRDKGRSFVRSGGTRAWRNSNPGNIRKGKFASAHGAIGDDGEFAVFPNEAVGMAAIEALLRTGSYAALSLRQAIHRYAPPVENDSDAYVNAVVRETNIAPGTRLDSLDKAQIGALAAAIRNIEGWREGAELEYLGGTEIS